MKYVLITPARNEEAFIEKTIQSVISQTQPPARWVIVDDGSTDRTGEVVRGYNEIYPWMRLIRRPRRLDRNFAAKVEAFNAGLATLGETAYDVIGNLDADVSFDPDYLSFLIRQFEADKALGVAGTPFLEEGYDSSRDSFEGENHVAGGCQLFRRECFKEVGGFIPNPTGCVDWIAVTTARMNGWKTRSFKEKYFFHHRTLGTAQGGTLSALYAYGQKDYYLGNHPLWEACRVAYRMVKRPLVFGGVALLLGYSSMLLRRPPRPVSADLMRFHRKEQMRKLNRILSSLLRLRKIDKFHLASEKTQS